MLIYFKYCKNCGVEYMWQASGSYQLDTPYEYNDANYCPECKKAIVEALTKISIKTEIRNIDSNDFTLDECIEIEKKYCDDYAEKNKNGFPLIKRVYSGMCKSDLSDSTHSKDFIIDDKFYIYTYWIKSKELITLKKKIRWDLINDKMITDEYSRIVESEKWY